MPAKPRTRLLDHLPAIYRDEDAGDALPALLQVMEQFFFVGHAEARVPGIERQLEGVPALFAPFGSDDAAQPHADDADRRTPDRFLPWLATWMSFAPRDLFTAERLRHIVAGIVPLYGMRGTRAYLEALLKLCFEEISDVHIDEHEDVGLRVGIAKLGIDSLLAEKRPFWFSVDIGVDGNGPRSRGRPASAPGDVRFEDRVRAVIEFAKPAHTAYVLRLRPGSAGTSPGV